MAKRAHDSIPKNFRPHETPFQTRSQTIEGIAAELAAILRFIDPTGSEAGEGRIGVSLTMTRFGLCGSFSMLAQIDGFGTIHDYLPTGLLVNACEPEMAITSLAQLAAWSWQYPDEPLCEHCQGVEGAWECSYACPPFSLERSGVCMARIRRSWSRDTSYEECALAIVQGFAVTQLCGEGRAPHSLSLTARFWSLHAGDEGELVDLSACNYWEAR